MNHDVFVERLLGARHTGVEQLLRYCALNSKYYKCLRCKCCVLLENNFYRAIFLVNVALLTLGAHAQRGLL